MTIKIRSDLFLEDDRIGKMPTNIQEEAIIFKIQQKHMNRPVQSQHSTKMKKITLRTAQENSDKVTCKICDTKVILSSMSSHSRVVHCLTLKEYELIYPDIYHQCNLCGERIIHAAFEISKHLSSKNHGLTFPEYREKYIKDSENSFSVEKHLTTSMQDTSREEMENFDETIAQQLLDKIDLLLDRIL